VTSATFARDTPTDQVISEVLAAYPNVATKLHAAHVAAWDAVDPIVLELCRLRIAQLLDNAAELAVRTPAATAAGLDEATIGELTLWPSSHRFGSRQRACLALCEQWLIDVGNVTSEQTEAVAAELGVQGLADFVSGLLVVEQRQRLRLVWEQLFESSSNERGSNGL
jgi:alkylhydroperoxidase family enzyme